MKITPEILEIHDYIQRNPSRTAGDISDRFKLHRHEALKVLHRLTELRMLKKEFKAPGYIFKSIT